VLVPELVVAIVDDVVRSQPTPPGTCRDSPSQSARRSPGSSARSQHQITQPACSRITWQKRRMATRKSPRQRARGLTWRKTKMSWAPKDLEVVVLVVPDRVVGRVDQEQCKMASARVEAERWGTNGAIQAPLPDWKSSS